MGADPPPDEWPDKNVVDACRRCPLWERATQGVPGEGARRAALMLVGEQPGDEEDLTGRPFVGPAGRLLGNLLEDIDADAARLYIANAVKHFSWEPRGKRRLHKTPAQREIEACSMWLENEIATVKPKVIVALGASALNAVLGKRMTISAAREATIELPNGARLIATYHPSAILRAPDEARKEELKHTLRSDLVKAKKLADK